MATFTTDQVRQFYVIKSKATSFDETTPSGAVAFKKSQDGDLFLTVKSPNSDIPVRSDLIGLDTVTYTKATKATKRPLGLYKVTLSPSINGGSPIVGQEYIVRIIFDAIGSYDHKLYEVVSHVVTPGDTEATVLKGLADEINLRFGKGMKFPKVLTVTSTATELIIEEKPQPWVLGKIQERPLIFKVEAGVIETADDIKEVWGDVKDETATNTNKVGNGKIAADMEWFYYGERADQFRGIGYPNNFENIYIVDPTKEYDFIDINYFYAGDAEDVQKSKKSITLCVATDSDYSLEDIVTDLKALGLEINVPA